MNYDLKSNSSTSVSYVCVSSFSYGDETVSSRPGGYTVNARKTSL